MDQEDVALRVAIELGPDANAGRRAWKPRGIASAASTLPTDPVTRAAPVLFVGVSARQRLLMPSASMHACVRCVQIAEVQHYPCRWQQRTPNPTSHRLALAAHGRGWSSDLSPSKPMTQRPTAHMSSSSLSDPPSLAETVVARWGPKEHRHVNHGSVVRFGPKPISVRLLHRLDLDIHFTEDLTVPILVEALHETTKKFPRTSIFTPRKRPLRMLSATLPKPHSLTGLKLSTATSCSGC